jgi:hypothetical protein
MKRDRYFYSITSFVLLLLMLIGFRHFLLDGKDGDGEEIGRPILTLVIIHGSCLMLWVILFFVQSVLIASKNRQLHMKLGWAAAAIALAIAVTGPFVATFAPRLHPTMPLFTMTYRQFILPMYTEIFVFTTFVALGLWYRKRPAVHRTLMLLATLSVASGSTSRIGFIDHLYTFPYHISLFGPVIVLGVLILLVQTIITRSFDKWFATGFAAFAAVYVTVMNVAVSESWTRIAERIAPG